MTSYSIAPGTSAEEQAAKRRLALALMTQGSDTSPVQHWTQGAARALQGALGGYEMYAAEKADKDERAAGNEMMAKFLAGGQPSASPVAADPASAAPANMAEPRGYRNNNPLNIEAGPFTQGQPGFQGSDGRFAKFASLDQGVGAAGKLLDVYEKKHGLNTVEGIVGRWAPAGDGNNVNAYAANVAKQLGIAPNEPVPPEMRERLIAAMAQHENGKPMPQMAQAAPRGPQQPNREMLIQMLGNRHTAPMAQSIIGAQISQQFKPQDYDINHRPDGSIIAVNKKNPQDMRVMQAPGGQQGAIDFNAKKAAAEAKAKMEAERSVTQPEKDRQAKATADIVTTDIDRALNKIDTAKGPTTGMWGSVLSNVGGTSARDVAGLLDTIKANAGFDTLAKMRAASPTGGALGSITEKELALLQATVGNLEQSQSAAQLKDNLRRVKNVYLDIVHGPGGGPAREKPSYESKGAPSVDDLVKKYAR